MASPDSRPPTSLRVLEYAGPRPRWRFALPTLPPVIRNNLLRLYRVALVALIVLVIHRQAMRDAIGGDAPIRIGEVQKFLPQAVWMEPDESGRNGLFVYDRRGQQVGYVLRTLPACKDVLSYSATPIDMLLVLDNSMKLKTIFIRSINDTKDIIQTILDDSTYFDIWIGKTWDELGVLDPDAKETFIEGVSGATESSRAMARSIYVRFKPPQADAAAQAASQRRTPLAWRGVTMTFFGWRQYVHTPVIFGVHLQDHDLGLIFFIVLAMLMAFTSLRSRTWVRRTFQIGLIVYIGLWNGRLIAQSLLVGWSKSTLPWMSAPGYVMLVAAALLIPWATRRAIYCSHICPHGAAQELLGRVTKKKFKLHKGVEAGLKWLPFLLIALVIVVAMVRLDFELADIEPFDAYIFRTAGWATIAVAVVGLIVSIFVPMAYCKLGCPTGMLLNFVRSHGHADGFGRRDLAAGLLTLGALALYIWNEPLRQWLRIVV